MGLKESGLRGSLRNVSVGIDAIPDSDVYLHDDWGDNKLQDRDDSGETTHNGEEGIYRPEWRTVADQDLPSVSDERVTLTGGEAMITDINLNLNETITWDLNDISDLSGSGADLVYFGMWNETEDLDSSERPKDGYALFVRDDNWIFQRIEDDGTNVDLINTSSAPGDDTDATITRDPSGEWEFFIDGNSQGTETDTTYTDPQYVTFSGRGDGVASIDEYKVS